MAAAAEMSCAQVSESLRSTWLTDYVIQIMQSPSWAGPIQEFIEAQCAIFDTHAPDENKLEYTDVHSEFKELVDSLLAAHLLEVDITPEEFAGAFEANAVTDPRLDAVTEQLLSVGDFLVFKKMMLSQSCKQQGQALVAQGTDSAVPSPPPTEATPSAEVEAISVPPRRPVVTMASRISAIVESASKEKSDGRDKAALVRAALVESSGRVASVRKARLGAA
mmetsp:Transcript_95651/g.205229  ORF Transcript_95651/g.205229 Transcript_95651/m.205229 type:complete len:221 (+) Transcript_95651:100-762(+)